MPIKNKIELAELAMDTIKRYTEDFELIVVNDGSDEETTKRLSKKCFYDVLVENKKSVGWCKAINQGLKVAKGDYVAFANSDVVATPNWFEKIKAHFDRDEKLGIVGPVSNQVSGLQHVDHNKPNLNFQYVTAGEGLMFFFVVVRRKVFEKIGGLDERFGLGGQDDIDYCVRAQEEGFKVGIARDVFIYHYGSATFREEFKNNIPKSKEYAKSQQRALTDKYKGSKPKIFIAIPSAGGKIVNELVTTLINWTHDERWAIQLYMPKGMFPLDNARNHCVQKFLEGDTDYLLWIDDDIVPPINALEKLLSADKDIIGGVGLSMKYENGVGFPYPVTLRYNSEKKYEVYYGQGIEECDATGGACVMFKRKVYEVIERPYQFQYNRNGTLALTCDFDVFQRAKKAGFALFIDFTIICDHIRVASIKSFQDLLVKNQSGMRNG